MDNFDDRSEVEVWARTLSREQLIAHQALTAARLWGTVRPDKAWVGRSFEIKTARAILTALVRIRFDTQEIREAAARANHWHDGFDVGAGPPSEFAIKCAMRAGSKVSPSEADHFAHSIWSDRSRYDLAQFLDEVTIESYLYAPLWRGVTPPNFNETWLRRKATTFAARDSWGFWVDWYEGLIEGRTCNWELWRRIALIPDEVWGQGPFAVAQAIDALVREQSSPVSDQQVSAQARRLIAQPRSTSFLANDLATKIEVAIADYMLVEQVNHLPETLSALYELPNNLRNIARSSQSADRISELEQQIIHLVDVAIRLSNEVDALRSSAKAKDGKPLKRIFIEQSVKTTATICTTSFWGSLAMGISHFTGIVDFGSALEALSEFGSSVEELENKLPDIVDT